jgi:hypothetical protein
VPVWTCRLVQSLLSVELLCCSTSGSWDSNSENSTLLFVLTMSSKEKVAKVSAGSSASVVLRHNAMLTDQIVAAKEAFGHCKLKPTTEALNSINAQLADGIVLPEYHAYITGAPTKSTIVLPTPSSNVVAGDEPMERTVNIIQDGEAMSQLVVAGIPCLNFTESHRTIWDYNKKATEAVVKLISTPAKMIGHGVEETTIVN